MNVSDDGKLEARTGFVLPVLKKQYPQEHGLTDDFPGVLWFYMVPKQGCDMTAD